MGNKHKKQTKIAEKDSVNRQQVVPVKALLDKSKERPRSIPVTATVDHSGHAIVFNFARLDLDAPFGNAAGMTESNMRNVLEFFKAYSTRKWSEVARDVHGRGGKSCHHFIAVSDLTAQARRRYAELFGDEGADFFYSLRRTGTFRLFGLKINGVFFVLWWDTTHQQICESGD